MANVLVVGTKAVGAKVIAESVQRMGHQTRALSSPEGVEQLLAREKFALLIAELGRDSFDLLRRVKMYSRGTRVIFISANASASDYKRALDEGALEVLLQPYDDDDLQAALRRAFEPSTEGTTKSIIHELSLTDLLQIMHMGRRSVTINVSPGFGRIHLACGEFVHATHYGSTGTAALRSMLQSEATSIQTTPATDVEQTIDAPFEMTLLDLMREIDEARRREASLDIFIEDVPPEPIEATPPNDGSRFAATLIIAMVLLAIVFAVGPAAAG